MGRIIAGIVWGCLLAAPALLHADERPGSSPRAGLSADAGLLAHAPAAAIGVPLPMEKPAGSEGLGAPPAGEGVSGDGMSATSPPAWRGFIGTLERRVRMMLARASESHRHYPIRRPPDPGLGRDDPDDGSTEPKGPSAADGAQDATMPVRLWFGPATPNPSVGVVMFRVDLPRAATVRIAVMDVAGRLVGEIRESREAGRHQMTWRGRGRAGAAGVYFARLEVDGRAVGVRRLVVLR